MPGHWCRSPSTTDHQPTALQGTEIVLGLHYARDRKMDLGLGLRGTANPSRPEHMPVAGGRRAEGLGQTLGPHGLGLSPSPATC